MNKDEELRVLSSGYLRVRQQLAQAKTELSKQQRLSMNAMSTSVMPMDTTAIYQMGGVDTAKSEAEKSALVEAMAKFGADKEQLKEQINELSNENSSLMKQISDYRVNIADLEAKLKVTETHKDIGTNKVEELDSEVSKKDDEIHKLKVESKRKDEDIELLNRQIEERDSKIKDLTERLSNYEDSVDSSSGNGDSANSSGYETLGFPVDEE